MKKIFALALAAVMTAGMTTVAFADSVEINSVEFGGASTRLFKYDSDDNVGKYVADDTTVLEPGATYYLSLEINGVESYLKEDGDMDIDAKDMNKYKVYADWKYGEIEDLEVAYKKIQTWDSTDGYAAGDDYRYVVMFTTPDDTTANAFIDVAGTVKVGTSSSKADKTTGFDLDATITKDYINPFDGDFGSYTDGAVVKFESDLGEIDIDFEDVAMFTVNVTGQGKLNLAYNTKYNKDFAYDYDDANIDFINFEGEPTTNRTGTLYIYADEDSYIYEVTSKGAKKINGAYYDDDEEAWVIRTRHLTSYAISDKKLKTVDQMNNGSSSSSGSKPGSNSGSGSNNGKPNPDTGR